MYMNLIRINFRNAPEKMIVNFSLVVNSACPAQHVLPRVLVHYDPAALEDCNRPQEGVKRTWRRLAAEQVWGSVHPLQRCEKMWMDAEWLRLMGMMETARAQWKVFAAGVASYAGNAARRRPKGR